MVESVEDLKIICRKELDEFILSRLFFRKISIYFTKLLLIGGITANQTSYISLFMLIFAGIFLILGSYQHSVTGALLILISLILDHSDGEIARYEEYKHNRNASEKKRGFFLECSKHSLFAMYLLTCISFGVYFRHRDIIFLEAGFSASLSTAVLVALGLMKLFPLLEENETDDLHLPQRLGAEKPSFSKRLRSLQCYIVTYNVFEVSILLGIICNLLPLLLLFYGCAIPVLSLLKFIQFYKRL